MASTTLLAVLGAVIIATGAAAFGVGMARMLWAEDLRHTQRLEETRRKTEAHLRNSIVAQAETIVILKRRLGETP